MASLEDIYRQAAVEAYRQGVSAGNESHLVEWIRANCSYREDTEFFLVLGIGCELADIEARAKGFESEAHRAYEAAVRAVASRKNSSREGMV